MSYVQLVKRASIEKAKAIATSREARKSSTYAVMHMVVAMAVAFALSGDWRIALGIGLIEPMVQTVAYAVHERFWARRSSKTDIEDTVAAAAVPVRA
ncbi:MAG: DUF2061 domain-containing protein [Alphaproteobacteria bacterium]|nr:DUF2061 domain-containing protein [Alphaproteobacteria bacterium]